MIICEYYRRPLFPTNEALRIEDLEYRGWELVFRATSGNGINVFKAWTEGSFILNLITYVCRLDDVRNSCVTSEIERNRFQANFTFDHALQCDFIQWFSLILSCIWSQCSSRHS